MQILPLRRASAACWRATPMPTRFAVEPPEVLVLTTFQADEYVLDALRSGAAGFLLEESDPVLPLDATCTRPKGSSTSKSPDG